MDAVTITAGPLLVPGAAGRAHVLTEYRAVVLDALGRLIAAASGPICVVAAGPGSSRTSPPASLGAYGIADGALGWPVDRAALPDATAHHPSTASGGVVAASQAEDEPPAGPSASLGLLALRAAGWAGPIEVVEIVGDVVDIDVAGEATDPGTALVVIGSAPRGTGGPWATDRVDGSVDEDCALFVHHRR